MRPTNLFSLKGRVALVTGAARGNGLAIAQGFLGAGALVYLIDILERELASLKRHLPARARCVVADVTDYPRMAEVLRDAFRREGRIDILVNNAGITRPRPSERYTLAEWAETQQVNLTTPFRLSQLAFPYMRRGGRGVIINLTSISSELGCSNNPAYAASKGGLKQLSKALAKDWAGYNIRVNNLGLGYFKTQMTIRSFRDKTLRRQRTERMLLGRWGDAGDLVGPAVFLASDASRYMTGQDLYVDGGWLANGGI